MKVLLISANTEQLNMLPLPVGLNCVAVAARHAGHEVELLDLMLKDDIVSSVKRSVGTFSPDVIGVSVRNIDNQNMRAPGLLLERVRDVVRLCREISRAPIVLGGAGYSIFPDSVLEYLGADLGIEGEGEGVFPMLLERLAAGSGPENVPGVHLRGRGIAAPRTYAEDLDALPLPDPGLSAASLAGIPDLWLPVQTRRGCPMNCSYCSTGTIEGRRVRKRSPLAVIDNIAAHARAGFQKFYFVDNTFNIPPSYAKKLCSLIIESSLAISWRCIMYGGRSDDEMVGLMARAGCVEVSLGFESGCDRMLGSMNKKFTAADIRKTSDMLLAHGIRRMGFLLLGGPGETRDSVLESLAFADSLGLDSVKVTAGIRIYPGTGLARTAVREGVISPDDDLLYPKFYMAPGLGEWIDDTVRAWTAERPGWVY